MKYSVEERRELLHAARQLEETIDQIFWFVFEGCGDDEDPVDKYVCLAWREGCAAAFGVNDPDHPKVVEHANKEKKRLRAMLADMS